jgi:sialidase-1
MALSLAIKTSHGRETIEVISKTELFRAGVAGYSTYRIPSLAVTNQGTILAAVAARFDSPSDWANVDTMMRRSTDGGQTWDVQRIVTDDDTNTVDNATFIVDSQNNTVYLMYQINYAQAYLKQSDDQGASWSPPREITSVFEEFRTRNNYDWQVIAMGPGHGITLQNGRMVVPVWLSTSRRHRPSIAATIYSDDQGRTWQAGEVIVLTTDRTPNPSEHLLVELSDGNVMANMRSESKLHRRLVSVSPDGATGWSEPKFDENLYDPICMAGFARMQPAAADDFGFLLFANPDSSQASSQSKTPKRVRERRNLTLRVSRDEGKSWPVAQVIEPGPSGYCDVAVGPEGTAYLLYEAGRNASSRSFVPQNITFAKVAIKDK